MLPLSRAAWTALAGDRTRAIQILTSAKFPNPDYEAVALSQAVVYQTLNKNIGAAQQLADEAVKISQGNQAKSFAIVASLLSHATEPVDQFQGRLQTSGLDAQGQIPAAALAYFFAGRYDQSLVQWETLLKANPGDLRAQVMRAATLVRLGRTTEALKDPPRLLMPNLTGSDQFAVPAFTELVRVRALAEKQSGKSAVAEKLNKAIAMYKW
jgi:tetratricopeptide (TPR) repeat protein